MFGLFDIVVQEYDYLVDVVFWLVDIVVQNMIIWRCCVWVICYCSTEYDYLADVVFGLFDIVAQEYDY